MTVIVELSNSQSDIITLESEKAFPRECCGLLIGSGENPVIVSRVVIAENLADSSNRFLIDPQCQFEWLRKLRGSDERIVGLYHSHPNGRVDPSPHDAEMAIEQGQIWLIVPVQNGKAEATQAFRSKGSGAGFDVMFLSIADET